LKIPHNFNTICVKKLIKFILFQINFYEWRLNMQKLLVVLIAILAVGLIMGCGEKKEEEAAEKPAEVKMVKDVVCGMDVDPATTTITADYEGEKYYFCAEECKEKFLENPDQYVHAADHDHPHDQGEAHDHEHKEGESPEHKH
jgi:YHS domain-containing protein